MIAGVGALVLVAVVLGATGVFPRKLSADGTERAVHRYTTYTSVACHREAGWLWAGWDYECRVRRGQECGIIPVEVNGSDVTQQGGPGSCNGRPG
jgi:hypothetical protein